MEYRYDGSYEGLLSCIFRIYQDKTSPLAINAEPDSQPALFDATISSDTNEEWASRVACGIDSRTNGRASVLVYNIFLSELPQREMLIYHLIREIIQKGDESILENYANPHVLRAAKIEKMMHREVHRMHAFVRFQKSRTGLFYAAIDPDFNVLPLIGDHFERRYADQPWLILDTRRHYGLHYDRYKRPSLHWIIRYLMNWEMRFNLILIQIATWIFRMKKSSNIRSYGRVTFTQSISANATTKNYTSDTCLAGIGNI